MTAIMFKTLGGGGEDIVLIHGFGSDRLSWLANSPALLPLARVHALDLPAHGESDAASAGDGTTAAMASAIAEMLRQQGIVRVHLVGHSLGGGIALLIAAENPALAASLSLIAPVALGRGVDRGFLAEYPELSDFDAAQAMLRRLVARPALINKMTVQRVLAHLGRDGVREAFRAIASQLVRNEAGLAAAASTVARHGIARLTIWGERDEINPMDTGRIAEFGGDFLAVPDAGHLPHIESSAGVNARLVHFLQQQITA